MGGAVLHAREAIGNVQDRQLADNSDVVLAELCATLFTSLPRSDQRRKGMEYLQGLLGAEGRKSVRNIATLIGGQATEQSLHHFVSSSAWDWVPVRRALAHYLARANPPRAWVAQTMVIPKAGENSVGVDRHFFPSLGQVMNAQQAIGVWSAADGRSHPVNWRLHLSPAWLEDSERRRRAAIPDAVAPESLGECAVEACLSMMHKWGLPIRPVVLDARETNAITTVRRLRAGRVPFLVRIGSTVPLTVADPALPSGGAEVPAHQIMEAIRDMRRPVVWRAHDRQRTPRTSLAAAVRVRIPTHRVRNGRPMARGDLLLLGFGGHRPWPGELWLSDLVSAPPADLLRLSKLTQRVEHDFQEISDQVGIRDYAGRSFGGWHRHITLASAAHAVAALTQGAAQRAQRTAR